MNVRKRLRGSGACVQEIEHRSFTLLVFSSTGVWVTRLKYSTKDQHLFPPSNGIDLTLIHLSGLDDAYHFHCSVLQSGYRSRCGNPVRVHETFSTS